MRTEISMDFGNERWAATREVIDDKEEAIIERAGRGERERLVLKIDGLNWRVTFESGDVTVSYRIKGDGKRGILEFERHGRLDRVSFENGKVDFPDIGDLDRTIQFAPSRIGAMPVELGVIFTGGGPVFAPNNGDMSPEEQKCLDEAKRKLRALGGTAIKGAAMSVGLSMTGALGGLVGLLVLYGTYEEVVSTQVQILDELKKCLEKAGGSTPQ